jgi:hypothetical protein
VFNENKTIVRITLWRGPSKNKNNKDTQVKRYEAVVWPVLHCGSQVWTITESTLTECDNGNQSYTPRSKEKRTWMEELQISRQILQIKLQSTELNGENIFVGWRKIVSRSCELWNKVHGENRMLENLIKMDWPKEILMTTEQAVGSNTWSPCW